MEMLRRLYAGSFSKSAMRPGKFSLLLKSARLRVI